MYNVYDSESNMALVNNFKPWLTDSGEGDALWRTGIAYIALNDKKYLTGILRAFTPVYDKAGELKKYQARRFNTDDVELSGIDDVSRDQVIMAWSSLYINKDSVELEDLVKNTSFRLSKRFTMTLTMWAWSRGLIGNKFMAKLGSFLLMIEMFTSMLWTKLIRSIVKYKEFSQIELEGLMREPREDEPWHEIGENIRHQCLNTKIKRIAWRMNFPGYGLHLNAWVNYTSPDGFFKRMVNKLIRIDMAEHNLLLRLLTGEDVDVSEIDEWLVSEEWMWSSRFNKMNRQRILADQSQPELDKIILYRIKYLNNLKINE